MIPSRSYDSCSIHESRVPHQDHPQENQQEPEEETQVSGFGAKMLLKTAGQDPAPTAQQEGEQQGDEKRKEHDRSLQQLQPL